MSLCSRWTDRVLLIVKLLKAPENVYIYFAGGYLQPQKTPENPLHRLRIDIRHYVAFKHYSLSLKNNYFTGSQGRICYL